MKLGGIIHMFTSHGYLQWLRLWTHGRSHRWCTDLLSCYLSNRELSESINRTTINYHYRRSFAFHHKICVSHITSLSFLNLYINWWHRNYWNIRYISSVDTSIHILCINQSTDTSTHQSIRIHSYHFSRLCWHVPSRPPAPTENPLWPFPSGAKW